MTNCAICLQLLQTPIKVLNCGHSFCFQCLDQMLNSTPGPSNRNRRRQLKCPTCRRPTLLRQGKVSSLPTNYALHDLLNVERRTTNGNSTNLATEERNDEEEDDNATYARRDLLNVERSSANGNSTNNLAAEEHTDEEDDNASILVDSGNLTSRRDFSTEDEYEISSHFYKCPNCGCFNAFNQRCTPLSILCCVRCQEEFHPYYSRSGNERSEISTTNFNSSEYFDSTDSTDSLESTTTTTTLTDDDTSSDISTSY